MRTLVNIPNDVIQKVALICQKENISRAEVIRRALEIYIKIQSPIHRCQAFGLWEKNKKNAFKFIARLRREWTK